MPARTPPAMPAIKNKTVFIYVILSLNNAFFCAYKHIKHGTNTKVCAWVILLSF
jgi:hypothetical protein